MIMEYPVPNPRHEDCGGELIYKSSPGDGEGEIELRCLKCGRGVLWCSSSGRQRNIGMKIIAGSNLYISGHYQGTPFFEEYPIH